jgi:hypothetical protein
MSRFITCCIATAVMFMIYSAHGSSFSFVALGDTAYNIPDDYPTYQALIQTINASKPEFSIHVGDIWGVNECTEKEYVRHRDFFQEYNHPVIYTPGDNEWADCAPIQHVDTVSRFVAGKASEEDLKIIVGGTDLEGGFERKLYGDWRGGLSKVRKTFFATKKSLGQHPIDLIRQADVSDFNEMVENAIWEHGNVLFGTIHVSGSANNFAINEEARALEAITRNRANFEWIKRIFAKANAQDASAAVIALHASLFVDGDGGKFTGKKVRGEQEGAYYWMVRAIRDLAAEFGRPVLLIHGDFHELIIDRPFLVSQGEFAQPKYANITRLQVYGAPEIRAVQVSVDTETPWVFSFSPLHN